jgi:hypothetical protein
MQAPPTLVHRMVRESSERYLTVIRQYTQLLQERQPVPAADDTADPPEEMPQSHPNNEELSTHPQEAGSGKLAALRGQVLDLQVQLEDKTAEAAILRRLLPLLRDEIDQLHTAPPAPVLPAPWQTLWRKLSQGK